MSRTWPENSQLTSSKIPAEVRLYAFDLARMPIDALPHEILVAEERQLPDTLPAGRRNALAKSRSAARVIIAQQCQVAADEVVLTRCPPFVAKLADGTELCRYSLSRTECAVAVALAPLEMRVGVDIEQRQDTRQARQLAKIFHPVDQRRIKHALRKSRMVTRLWTLTEAILKAKETGLLEDPAAYPIGPARRPQTPTGMQARVMKTLKTTTGQRHEVSLAWMPSS